ncbi:MAG: M1 family metallopeptidase [Vicingaceae bacterium]
MKSSNLIQDIHSYSKPNIARVLHLDLDLNVDFEQKKLSGRATYKIDLAENADEIVFDTYDLNIEHIFLDNNEVAQYSLGPKDEILGQPLSISLTPGTSKVVIEYTTSPGARALQWLSPDQTAQKDKPFLFTQSQAILARTWIPCQDSPGIRFTYNANVIVPKGYLALMSAENPTVLSDDGVYTFSMPQPIPSYLMALTVGGIEFRNIGNRTGVYAEPVMLDRCHQELSEMEDMLTSAESLYGPYAWGRYDVIVLPPSFPFGGMENPRLTFATPTIIAGDKSLTSLIAHELAHSWSGNLVTNATWDDFWLNEGFTVYFEQRIMEAVYGRDYSEMLALLSYQGLLEEMEEISEKNPEDTKLKLNLKDRDPDDGMSAIAYDKGYLFLRKLEETMGRDSCDEFLKGYFTENAFQVMDTEQFLGLLKAHLSQKELGEMRIDDWVYGEGLPKNHPVIASEKFKAVDKMSAEWMNSGDISKLDTEQWCTHEWLHFINNLPEVLGPEKLGALDHEFGLTNSGNAEILAAWFQLVLPTGYSEADQAVEQFLTNVGRRKFLTPTYKALIKKDPSMELAKNIYRKARSNYHSVSVNTLDELLKWKG